MAEHLPDCGCAACIVARPVEAHPADCACDDCGCENHQAHVVIRYTGLREKIKQAKKRSRQCRLTLIDTGSKLFDNGASSQNYKL